MTCTGGIQTHPNEQTHGYTIQQTSYVNAIKWKNEDIQWYQYRLIKLSSLTKPPSVISLIHFSFQKKWLQLN